MANASTMRRQKKKHLTLAKLFVDMTDRYQNQTAGSDREEAEEKAKRKKKSEENYEEEAKRIYLIFHLRFPLFLSILYRFLFVLISGLLCLKSVYKLYLVLYS